MNDINDETANERAGETEKGRIGEAASGRGGEWAKRGGTEVNAKGMPSAEDAKVIPKGSLWEKLGMREGKIQHGTRKMKAADQRRKTGCKGTRSAICA